MIVTSMISAIISITYTILLITGFQSLSLARLTLQPTRISCGLFRPLVSASAVSVYVPHPFLYFFTFPRPRPEPNCGTCMVLAGQLLSTQLQKAAGCSEATRHVAVI